MKKLIIAFLFIPIIVFGQNKKYTFFSDYQFDKTYDGTNVVNKRKVTISFSDPKSITIEGTEFEKLPKGFIKIKYEDLKEISEEIIFMGRNKSDADIYSILNSGTGYDVIYIIKSTHKLGQKTYGYTILLGKADENNLGGLPTYFTAFHSNLKK